MREKTYMIVKYLHEHLDEEYHDSIARREAEKKLHEFLFWLQNAPTREVAFEDNLSADKKELEIEGPLIKFGILD